MAVFGLNATVSDAERVQRAAAHETYRAARAAALDRLQRALDEERARGADVDMPEWLAFWIEVEDEWSHAQEASEARYHARPMKPVTTPAAPCAEGLPSRESRDDQSHIPVFTQLAVTVPIMIGLISLFDPQFFGEPVPLALALTLSIVGGLGFYGLARRGRRGGR